MMEKITPIEWGLTIIGAFAISLTVSSYYPDLFIGWHFLIGVVWSGFVIAITR